MSSPSFLLRAVFGYEGTSNDLKAVETGGTYTHIHMYAGITYSYRGYALVSFKVSADSIELGRRTQTFCLVCGAAYRGCVCMHLCICACWYLYISQELEWVYLSSSLSSVHPVYMHGTPFSKL